MAAEAARTGNVRHCCFGCQSNSRDGKFIEKIGVQPTTNPAIIDLERWQSLRLVDERRAAFGHDYACCRTERILMRKHLANWLRIKARTQDQADAKLADWKKSKGKPDHGQSWQVGESESRRLAKLSWLLNQRLRKPALKPSRRRLKLLLPRLLRAAAPAEGEAPQETKVIPTLPEERKKK